MLVVLPLAKNFILVAVAVACGVRFYFVFARWKMTIVWGEMLKAPRSWRAAAAARSTSDRSFPPPPHTQHKHTPIDGSARFDDRILILRLKQKTETTREYSKNVNRFFYVIEFYTRLTENECVYKKIITRCCFFVSCVVMFENHEISGCVFFNIIQPRLNIALKQC